MCDKLNWFTMQYVYKCVCSTFCMHFNGSGKKKQSTINN